jgi:hypothetical protein
MKIMSNKKTIREHVGEVVDKVSEEDERSMDKNAMAIALIPKNALALVLYQKTDDAYV